MYSVINLLCGIGMFLTGMALMSDYATKTYGDKLKNILSKLTKNKISGVLTGMAVTGVIQSSCVTTVTAVSFVEAGFLSIAGAAGIVMGANIGTTVTSLIIAVNFSDFAPIVIFIGAFMKLLCKSEKAQNVGVIFSGFGILFVGLNTMASGFESLKNSDVFLSFVSASKGRLGGILTGFIMTALLQSSSATVGILQALSMQGIVPIEDGFYIILGQNIGAVLPVLLSCVGTGKTAKQVGVIHLLFNLIGTTIFLLLMEFIPFARLFGFLTSDSMKISLFHIMFNIFATIILLPFSENLIDFSEKIVRFSIVKTRFKKT